MRDRIGQLIDEIGDESKHQYDNSVSNFLHRMWFLWWMSTRYGWLLIPYVLITYLLMGFVTISTGYIITEVFDTNKIEQTR